MTIGRGSTARLAVWVVAAGLAVAWGISPPRTPRTVRPTLPTIFPLTAQDRVLVLALVAFKYARLWLGTIALRPLPAVAWWGWAAVATVAVIFRTPTQRSWIRGCQTVLAIVSILILAIHVPGVWR